MGKLVAYKKQNSVLEIFITESRLPFAQISSIYRKRKTNKQTNKQNKTHKTKQGSTLNILTEIGSESARYITRLLGQTANFGSSFRLAIKFINESKWNRQTKRFLANKITAA